MSGCTCTLNMSILAITVVNVLPSNVHKPLRDSYESASATNHV